MDCESGPVFEALEMCEKKCGDTRFSVESVKANHCTCLKQPPPGLGTVRLQDPEGRRVKIPTPTEHPSDPLNWSQPFKWYVLFVSCVAVLLVNFVGAGPSIALPQIAISLTGVPPDISKASYLFSTSVLFQGFSALWWMPFVNKLGRRPVAIVSLALFTAGSLGCALASKSYTAQMIMRFLIGCATGAIDSYLPIIITDLFFVYERGVAMAVYSSFLAMGVSLGSIVFGTLVTSREWTDCYWLSAGLVGALWLLVVGTIPETAFKRPIGDSHKKMPPGRCFNFWSGMIYTQESVWKMAIRPVGLLFFPAVMWSTVLFGCHLGFVVIISTNITMAYSSEPFRLTTQGIGFLSFAGLLGAILGVFQGGLLVDWVSKALARRNGGVFEPEMRLPALLPSLIFSPLGLLLYGFGLEKHLSWTTGAAALFLVNYSITSATNITLTYTVDILKPIASELVITVLVFKGIIGFLMASQANDWIARTGYSAFFIITAVVSFLCLSPVFIFYTYGRKISERSVHWRLSSWALSWHQDRN